MSDHRGKYTVSIITVAYIKTIELAQVSNINRKAGENIRSTTGI